MSPLGYLMSFSHNNTRSWIAKKLFGRYKFASRIKAIRDKKDPLLFIVFIQGKAFYEDDH